MESYEKRSDQAESQADRLEEEGSRVERSIEETKSDWESKKGQVPGMESPEVGPVPAEAVDDEGDEPNTTSVD